MNMYYLLSQKEGEEWVAEYLVLSPWFEEKWRLLKIASGDNVRLEVIEKPFDFAVYHSFLSASSFI